jgi:hypothetical protein
MDTGINIAPDIVLKKGLIHCLHISFYMKSISTHINWYLSTDKSFELLSENVLEFSNSAKSSRSFNF